MLQNIFIYILNFYYSKSFFNEMDYSFEQNDI